MKNSKVFGVAGDVVGNVERGRTGWWRVYTGSLSIHYVIRLSNNETVPCLPSYSRLTHAQLLASLLYPHHVEDVTLIIARLPSLYLYLLSTSYH